MLIAVIDACIFIDLIELKISSHFFKLDLEVHTTIDVWHELYNSQQEILNAYQSVGKLTIHILEANEMEEITGLNYPRNLSPQDQSVIYIADKLNAMLLSSDKAVRNFAKSMAIDHHGMFWILDQLVENALIPKGLASSKLHELLENNIMYNNNMKLWKEANKLFKQWDR